MRRTDRLFEIIQLFRDGRLHTGADIAERVEVSLRTIYRDIDTLISAGVPITGERGVGYMMTEPFFLPPLNLTHDELEVLELGIAMVQSHFGDTYMQQSRSLTDKVKAVLPRAEMMDPARSAIGIYQQRFSNLERSNYAVIRRAILTRTLLSFNYMSLQNQHSSRLVRPLEIQLWESALTLTAWCENRNDFRVFRLDNMSYTALEDKGFKQEHGKTIADYKIKLSQLVD